MVTHVTVPKLDRECASLGEADSCLLLFMVVGNDGFQTLWVYEGDDVYVREGGREGGRGEGGREGGREGGEGGRERERGEGGRNGVWCYQIKNC